VLIAPRRVVSRLTVSILTAASPQGNTLVRSLVCAARWPGQAVPAVNDAAAIAPLQIKRNSLLLRISQVDYLSEGEAVVFSDEYHLADAFSVTVYRKGGGHSN
jgi:hypothetical protein